MSVSMDMFACNTAEELRQVKEERDRYKKALIDLSVAWQEESPDSFYDYAAKTLEDVFK